MLEAAVQWPWLNLSASSIPDILECRATQQQQQRQQAQNSAPSSEAVGTIAGSCEPITMLPQHPAPVAIPADAARQRVYLQQLVRAAYAATLKTSNPSSGTLNKSLGESACKLEAFAAALRQQESVQRAKMDRIRKWAQDVANATAADTTAPTAAPVILPASHFGVYGSSIQNGTSDSSSRCRLVAKTEGTDDSEKPILNLVSLPSRTVSAAVPAVQAAAALRALAALANAAAAAKHTPHAVDHAIADGGQPKKCAGMAGTTRLQAACSVAPPSGPTMHDLAMDGMPPRSKGSNPGPHSSGCGCLKPLLNCDNPDGGDVGCPEACPRQLSLMPTGTVPVPEADHKLQPRQSTSAASPTPRVIKPRGSVTSWSSIDTAAVTTPHLPPLHNTSTPIIMENYHPSSTPLDLVSAFAKKRRRRADSMPSTPREREFKTLKTLKDENASGLARSSSTRGRLLSPVQAYPSPQASPVLEGNALGLSGVQMSADDNEPRFGLGLLSPSA